MYFALRNTLSTASKIGQIFGRIRLSFSSKLPGFCPRISSCIEFKTRIYWHLEHWVVHFLPRLRCNFCNILTASCSAGNLAVPCGRNTRNSNTCQNDLSKQPVRALFCPGKSCAGVLSNLRTRQNSTGGLWSPVTLKWKAPTIPREGLTKMPSLESILSVPGA